MSASRSRIGSAACRFLAAVALACTPWNTRTHDSGAEGFKLQLRLLSMGHTHTVRSESEQPICIRSDVNLLDLLNGSAFGATDPHLETPMWASKLLGASDIGALIRLNSKTAVDTGVTESDADADTDADTDARRDAERATQASLKSVLTQAAKVADADRLERETQEARENALVALRLWWMRGPERGQPPPARLLPGEPVPERPAGSGPIPLSDAEYGILERLLTSGVKHPSSINPSGSMWNEENGLLLPAFPDPENDALSAFAKVIKSDVAAHASSRSTGGRKVHWLRFIDSRGTLEQLGLDSTHYEALCRAAVATDETSLKYVIPSLLYSGPPLRMDASSSSSNPNVAIEHPGRALATTYLDPLQLHLRRVDVEENVYADVVRSALSSAVDRHMRQGLRRRFATGGYDIRSEAHGCGTALASVLGDIKFETWMDAEGLSYPLYFEILTGSHGAFAFQTGEILPGPAPAAGPAGTGSLRACLHSNGVFQNGLFIGSGLALAAVRPEQLRSKHVYRAVCMAAVKASAGDSRVLDHVREYDQVDWSAAAAAASPPGSHEYPVLLAHVYGADDGGDLAAQWEREGGPYPWEVVHAHGMTITREGGTPASLKKEMRELFEKEFPSAGAGRASSSKAQNRRKSSPRSAVADGCTLS